MRTCVCVCGWVGVWDGGVLVCKHKYRIWRALKEGKEGNMENDVSKLQLQYCGLFAASPYMGLDV